MNVKVGDELPELVKHPTTRQLVTDWLGDRGTLKTFEVSYRGVDMPGHPYRCRGRVARVEGDDVELEVWGEDETGKRTTVGTATVQMRD